MDDRRPGCADQRDGDERAGPKDQTHYQLRRPLPHVFIAGSGSLCHEWNPLPGRVSSSVSMMTTCSKCCRTGETPWVKLMIEKYHETAKSNGAIVSELLIVMPCMLLTRPDHTLGWHRECSSRYASLDFGQAHSLRLLVGDTVYQQLHQGGEVSKHIYACRASRNSNQ